MGELITALNAFAAAKINHRGRTARAGAILRIVFLTASGSTDANHSRRPTNRRLLADHRPFDRDRRLIDHRRLINDGRLIDYRCRGGIRATAEHDHALSLRRSQAQAGHGQQSEGEFGFHNVLSLLWTNGFIEPFKVYAGPQTRGSIFPSSDGMINIVRWRFRLASLIGVLALLGGNSTPAQVNEPVYAVDDIQLTPQAPPAIVHVSLNTIQTVRT